MDDPSTLLALDAGIRRCANVAADCMVTTAPELNRDKIAEAFVKELWMTVGEITELSRSGALLV